MLRKFGLLLMILALLLMGCHRTEPDDTTQQPHTAEATEPVETTEPAVTTAPTEPAPMMDADAVFRKMALNLGNKWLRGYDKNAEVIMESEDSSYHMTSHSSFYMSTSPFQVYEELVTEIDLDSAGMEMSMTDTVHTYVRLEKATPVGYTHNVTYDEWYRYEMEETVGDLMYAYSTPNILSSTPPDGLRMEQELQILDGREVYVLNCTVPGTELYGPDAENVSLENWYYVDAESFMLVKLETAYYGMDDYLTSMIGEMVGMDIGDADMFTRLEMREELYHVTIDPVEVPEVPQEGVEKSQDITDLPIEEDEGMFL